MSATLQQGEHVRHNKKADWGIGKIITINKGGTIQVAFAGNKIVSIAKGSKYLVKVP